jgi:hypothetical protein
MKPFRLLYLITLFILTLGFSQHVFAAGNIDNTFKYSQFLNIDLDNSGTNDQINWSPTNGGATVTNSAITGNIWGDTVGWINLNPTTGGVTNTCSGDVGGYAWGQNTGWINFSPTNGGVHISTTTGQFSGYAWSQNYGWIKFDCGSANSCVKTSWAGCTVPPGNPTDPTGPQVGADLCLNIPGVQPIVPNGYYRIPSDLSQPGNCYLPDGTADICPNIAGNQTSVPAGLTLVNGQCVPSSQTTDVCVNLVGNQTSVPPGYSSDGAGFCFQSTIVDLCTNIVGIQLSVPPGYTKDTPGNHPGLCYQSTTVLPQCSDGIDNDGDGYVDYPNDPGCLGPVDPTEHNPYVPPTTTTPSTNPPTTQPPTGPTVTPTTPITTTPLDIPTIQSSSSIGKLIATALGIIGLLSTIPGFATRLVNLLLAIPFYRKRRPWGIVYDSVSKQTLDPVLVTVYNADTGEKFDEKITDINGRYGFLLPIGNYRIIAQKTHYQFPTQKLPHTNSDGVYDNLYFGEDFSVTDTSKSTVVTLNIPMDQLEGDWNQEEKRRMNIHTIQDFFLRNTKLWERTTLTLFILGFAFSIYALTVAPNVWNTIVCSMYLAVTLLQLIGFGPVSEGEVVDAYGNKVAGAVVRVWSAHLGTEITKRVTNNKGQYYLLVAKGDYYITVDRKNASGGFDRVYTSPTMKIRKGVVNKKIKI